MVETKTHATATVYLSDLIQLSAYAYLLGRDRRFAGRPVAPVGYVRHASTTEVRYLPAELLSEPDMEALWVRYHAVHGGRERPRTATSRAVCETCHFQAGCPAAL